MSSSAASSVSALHDPASAVGSSNTDSPGGSSSIDNTMSMHELLDHLDGIQASLGGREPDASDLDDDGWRAVSKSGRIVELGSLGEGAGGAVTRCILKGGKTVFALKVSDNSRQQSPDGYVDGC
jgi:mitogen-activated protein kinase kinase